METQVQVNMAHNEFKEERTKELVAEITEEQFLKDLYLFMKKRETPIERIPHLGFKQIDLFVMFKTVNDLGGYHQVTAQQLWKQVYNTLGGNPRSTSAATCTRRHYEKLLLPYECHVKGISIRSMLPHHQPKPFHFVAGYSEEEEDDGVQRPAKRRLVSVPVYQNPHNLQTDQHGNLFPLSVHYPPYYQSSPTVLPPYIPMPPSILATQHPPAPKPQFSYSQPCVNSTERVKEPLEHLRYLAERYKTSSGLAEPLNLSVKSSARDISNNPVSSFAPPSASKNPKFLNKPSTLYAHHHTGAPTNEGSETQDGESSDGVAPSPYTMKAQEEQVIDVDITAPSSSPIYDSALPLGTEAAAVAQKPCSPNTDLALTPKEETKVIPEVMGLNLSQILSSLPQEKDGKMEIELPLSVFHKLLKMCKSSAMMHESKVPQPTQEGHPAERNWPNANTFPTNLTFHTNPQRQSCADDLTFRNVPNLSHNNKIQNQFMSYKPLPSGAILKNAVNQDVLSVDQQDINKSYNSKSPNFWGAHKRETQSSIEVESDPSPPRTQPDFAYKFYAGVQGGKQQAETEPSAMLMVNSSSAPLFQLTTEEVMKLKKIISNSL
ncbi:AT-rich interaction domain 6 isoform X2 [Neolamprologus brichardi]|uniref:AT-rich interaction domain 6 isoform X2 n=1 Tax=Neolamprologus brichardi TaxID=32507 RepID=UPI0016438E54|nr:AT-rich interaction domain 6 isoform X2 [Neolamprologus brichardi]